MTAVPERAPRIATLDIVRGVAVMGILAMNIVAFAMPFPAYMNPYAYGMDGARRPRLVDIQLHPDRRQDARALLLPVRREHAARARPRRSGGRALGQGPFPPHGLAARVRPAPFLFGLVRRHPQPLRAARHGRLVLPPEGAARFGPLGTGAGVRPVPDLRRPGGERVRDERRGGRAGRERRRAPQLGGDEDGLRGADRRASRRD